MSKPSANLTVRYHCSRREHFQGNLISPDTIKHIWVFTYSARHFLSGLNQIWSFVTDLNRSKTNYSRTVPDIFVRSKPNYLRTVPDIFGPVLSKLFTYSTRYFLSDLNQIIHVQCPIFLVRSYPNYSRTVPDIFVRSKPNYSLTVPDIFVRS